MKEQIDPWWYLPFDKMETPKEIKIEIILDVELFDKIKSKNLNEYIIDLIKNDNVI